MPVSVDAHGQSVPGEVPTLFGGDIIQYIKATGCEIPLIVSSCIKAIEKEGRREVCVKSFNITLWEDL